MFLSSEAEGLSSFSQFSKVGNKIKFATRGGTTKELAKQKISTAALSFFLLKKKTFVS